VFFFFSSRRRHTRCLSDWSSDVCSSDLAFDAVYSFGVLQHIPAAQRAVAEIHRVLKPGGDFLLMLYNRTSINYALEIKVLRKMRSEERRVGKEWRSRSGRE